MPDIDPREYGRLENEVHSLRTEVNEMRADIRTLLAAVENAKGGWKMLLVVGMIAGALGSGLTKVLALWR